MRNRIIAGTVLLAFGAKPGFAQQTDLDPVTVTASMNPIKASQTGRNLVVIKGEKFAALPVHSVDELLRYVPGVEVQARGPMGAQSDIVLRGGTFQQVLVIIDGVRVNDPNTGHFTSYIPIAPGEIDRIEVLKGASSALYGSEAVGGVVNIITKTFATKPAVKTVEAAAQLTAGEYALLGANAGFYASNGKTSFGAGILSNNTDGQPQRGIRGFVHANTVSASVSHRFNERWSLALRSSFDKRRFAAQNFYTNFASDTAQETVQTIWNQLQLSRNTDKNTLRFQAGYKNLTDSFAFNPRSATNQSKSNLWQALVSDEIRLSGQTVLSTGLQYINKNISSNDRGNHSLGQAAAFLVWNQRLNENLFITPAARMEWNERSGWEFVPQVNLSYRVDALQIRGSAGKTIRDADFTERFNNYNKAFVASGRIGNPDLGQERSFTYEAGADYLFSNSLKLSATFFQRLHKDLIDYVSTPYLLMPRKVNLSPTGTYLLAENIADVTTTGVETDVQFSKTLSANSGVWATLGFTWLQSDTKTGTPSLYLSSHARYLGNLNVQYTHRLFSLSVSGLYKQRQSQKDPSPVIARVSRDYFVVNAKGEAFLWKKNVSAFVEVDNLTDRSYTDLLGAQMPGRWLMAGIKISLTK
ncbi:TonB-dependent receptor plug domain-containing protein [Flavisolibacter nicotianae]|uniref:TonB-dependent receptor plug domain-containing protein n=1 Tax=Flavisolibacter nicotianae TaxID=2364882 RepID=UPI000EADFA59|nr:TonB-dependent receptor [Flavisolibacter nicotianae]